MKMSSPSIICKEMELPAGQQALEVTEGQTLSFTITPAEGYFVSNVFVDETDIGAVTEYVLKNITASHSIRVVFAPIPTATTAQETKEKLVVELSPSYKHTGKKIIPAIKVYYGTLLLKEDVDYILAYRDNKDVGTAYVDVIGINDFSGYNVSMPFAIVPAKGKTYIKNGLKYKVTNEKSKKVTLVGVSKKSITSVSIGKEIKLGTMTYKVTKIGNNAFKNCKKLKKITILSTSITVVGKNALKGIHKKAVIKVPASKYKAYAQLLKKKGQKKTVSIKK